MKKASQYIITKFTGAGFALTLGFILFLFLTEFNLFEFTEGISSPFFWSILYGYGVITSFIIDFISEKVSFFKNQRKITLYIIAGFLFFLFNGINMFSLIAGAVGALCACIFYLGTYLSARNLYFKFSFSFLLPIAFLLLSFVDFTEKEGWSEKKEATSYQASFDYFNGKHEIPLQVKQGDQISLKIDVTPINGGGHGFHVKDKQGDLVGLEEEGDKFILTAEYSGIYHIVVKGLEVQGELAVDWEFN